MTRTFNSGRYVNIVDSGSEDQNRPVQDEFEVDNEFSVDTKMVELPDLPEIDAIDEIAIESDESDNTERV